ncbi:AhpC/TSA antioxidant enzyme-domain-containing protein [Pterulicium gracile]|uniref:AhpC/TSA antioxidant enzyme-domain-containing protein n=1 Tax=Pterulicium gracile TaxID=1884261 RepID=A0A5C3QVU4_9AGAR|nr:AhpC/TSA antioxidant enzyme-domain-containing protein [Pterula gracilis]
MSVSSRPHRIPRKPVPSVDSNLLSAFSTSSALNTTFTSAIPPQALPFNLDQPPPSPGSRIPALISCSSPAVGRFPSHLPVPPAPSSSVLAPFSGCLSDDAGKKRPRSSNDNATTSQSRPNAFSLLKGPVKAALAAGKHRDISIQHRAQTRVSLSTPPPCSPSLTTGSNTVSYMPSASSSSLGFDHNFALPPLTFDMDFADRNNSFCSEAAKSVWSDESSISQRTATGRPRLFSYPPVTPSPALTTPPFSEFGLPSTTQLQLSRFLYVISESGIRVKFGDLWQGQKTVVIFIRHFWCPLCQDYMFSISRNVSPAVLEDAGVKVVVISNGSYEMIKSYRSIFRAPFEIYTDPTLQVYTMLGMTRKTPEKSPESPNGTYVRHGFMSGFGMVLKNAVKSGMPFWANGGDIGQLGGEFVFGPGLVCTYAHRMTTTRSHVPILRVLQAAGVDMITPLRRNRSFSGRSFLPMTEEELEIWRQRRRNQLSVIKGKRQERRGGSMWCSNASFSTLPTISQSGRSSSSADETSTVQRPRYVASSFVSARSQFSAGPSSAPATYTVKDAATSTPDFDESDSEYLSSRPHSLYSYETGSSDDDDQSVHSIARSIFMESILNITSHNTISMLAEPSKDCFAPEPLPPIPPQQVMIRSPRRIESREDAFFTGANLFMVW